MTPAPAQGGAWNVIEANRSYLALLESLEGDPAEIRNVLCQLCAPHLSRPFVTNWEEVMRAVPEPACDPNAGEPETAGRQSPSLLAISRPT